MTRAQRIEILAAAQAAARAGRHLEARILFSCLDISYQTPEPKPELK